MPDTRTISDFRFGLEWEPKLAEVMAQHPWQDSEFVAGDPTAVCKICGGGVASAKHDVVVGKSLVDGSHDFIPSDPFSEDKIAAARDEWRRRMANLPTPEAERAWEGIHAEKMGRLKDLFLRCLVNTREDIELLGCTGCVAAGLSLDDVKFLRIGLAGSGVGLPCFVPPDRYCLAHETTGGLQDGQGQLHAEFVEKVARPLTAAEQAHAKLVQAARKSEREYGAHSMLHGHTLPPGWQEMDGADGGAQVETVSMSEAGEIFVGQRPIVVKPWDDLAATMSPERRAAVQARVDAEVGKIQDRLWKCTEHDKINWACRHCVAQAVVEGELTPVFRVATPMGVGVIEAAGIDAEIAELNKGSFDHVEVFVQAARFTRRLARD